MQIHSDDVLRFLLSEYPKPNPEDRNQPCLQNLVSVNETVRFLNEVFELLKLLRNSFQTNREHPALQKENFQFFHFQIACLLLSFSVCCL